MAEVQKTSQNNGEVVQKFLQLVMMQAQNTLYVLGKIPTPDGRVPAPNLEAAKMLIDQLEVIKIKTQGNLNKQEAAILEEALSSVQMAFVEVSGGTPASMMPSRDPGLDLPEIPAEEPAAAPAASAKPAAPVVAAPVPAAPADGKSEETKVKFHKSYG
ncbi:MAG: DUF1844 domain-containing protein [Verrucomicrobiales bacterium]|jgi:hypothetical protein|nr:DUF1844 domain-containing protein [Verrucomicrobiales bacterium]